MKIHSSHEQAKAHFEKPQKLANSDNGSEISSPRMDSSPKNSPIPEMIDSQIGKKFNIPIPLSRRVT